MLRDDDDRATVAEAVGAGAFGAGLAFLAYEPDGRAAGQDQYASVVRFGTVTAAVGDGARHRRHRLVIKRKHPRADMREMLGNDRQFGNERRFYELVAPFLVRAAGAPPPSPDRVPPLCRYFYGRNDGGALAASRDAIVLEDVRDAGFRPSEQRLDLDVGHLTVALTTLAKFHGLSYRAKHERPAEFSAMVAGFADTQCTADGRWALGDSVFAGLFPVYVDRLRERGAGAAAAERVRRFRAEFMAGGRADEAMRRAMEPAEPLAVLCHGDYNRNNLLFRYGDDGGAPADALPLDLATARYGSPALDLSFFLYLNAGRAVRDAHWDRLLDAYCAALAAAVADAPVPVPDRATLDAEMRARGFYGLAHVAFFARIMTEEQLQPDHMLQFVGMDADDVGPTLLKWGGERATERVVDAVEHFLRVRYGEPSAQLPGPS